jgi:hypothetical protein
LELVSRKTILASGHQPHQQAGHMDASDPIRPSKNSCGTGAVHIWVPAQGRDDVVMRARPKLGQRRAFVGPTDESTPALGQWPTWQTKPEGNGLFTID